MSGKMGKKEKNLKKKTFRIIEGKKLVPFGEKGGR